MRRKPAACSYALGPSRANLQELAAVAERPVLVAVGDDVARQDGVEAGDTVEERFGRGVDVDADRVDAVLDHRVQGPRQPGLADVVLVLADPDRLWLDLDQLGERVLQPPRDRRGAAQRHVDVGKLARRELGRRVDRRACLADHQLLQAEVGVALHELAGELVGLARCGAVADADQGNTVLAAQQRQVLDRAVPVAAWHVRVDGGGVEQLARAVDHRDLDAGTQARVQTKDDARPGRRGQQQIA